MIASYAFISHSPSTYPHREPEIDNAPLARRKRRRTSPNELQILYSEFERCAKPPRHVRQDIAERVGMTEKAVQIWFQNRRQSSRRALQQQKKPRNQRPAPASASSSLSSVPDSSSPASLSESRSSQPSSSSPGPESPSSSASASHLAYLPFPQADSSSSPAVPRSMPISLPPISQAKGVLTPSSASFTNVMSMAAITHATPSASTPTEPAIPNALAASTADKVQLPPLRSAVASSKSAAPPSNLRLAMSVDGKAKVVFGELDGDKSIKEESNGKENLAAISAPTTTASTTTSSAVETSTPTLPSVASSVAMMTTQSDPAISEYECVQNLLQLRRGTWI
ncbi:hypothetical protein BZA70DRAFT_270622 [Myxozyma melibiosi]|uniref:Homeobox domain-containing protein n=1 Tax=Myxozyma melibiosi TaxID=54550 RepID=A0ABR1FBD1_9ASCO